MRDATERCGRCRWPYPPEMLSAFVSSRGRSPFICGICALELTNEIHHLNLAEFHGETAEDFRLDAIDWRATHPELSPTTPPARA